MEECRVRYGKQPNNLSTKCGVWAHAGIKFDPWLFSIGVFCLHGGHTLAFKSLNAIVRKLHLSALLGYCQTADLNIVASQLAERWVSESTVKTGQPRDVGTVAPTYQTPGGGNPLHCRHIV